MELTLSKNALKFLKKLPKKDLNLVHLENWSFSYPT
jgi:mRNA-degrading endonuclease RelE of RelBE toxin-antitoxin system